MPIADVWELERWIDPEDVFVDLARDGGDLFWLDSGVDGVSWVGTGPRAALADVAAAPAGGEAGASLLDGGWVGWLDYEHGAAGCGAPAARAAHPARFVRVDRVVRFDAASRQVSVRGDAAFVDRLRAVTHAERVAPSADVGAASARISAVEHADRVRECRELIAAGEAYQLCLTTRFTVDARVDEVAAYRRLRASAASHHGGFLRIGDVTLLSISPELFLHIEGDTVTTKPIKGTRPRGIDDADDRRLALELERDAKERAENVMIVDLMRNDLSRVCRAGSIAVPELWRIETYPTVHQLVSRVEGRLRPDMTAGEVWRATFPAGSMTGAPKLSAMTHLARLEGAPRGIYSGCFGWVGAHGGMDLAMVIRSVVITAESAYVGSGGGITWGSVPENEVAEVGVKARVPLAALGARVPEGW